MDHYNSYARNYKFFFHTSQMLNVSTLPDELCSFSNLSVTSPTSQLILQPFRCFTYVTAHSPTIPSLYLRHSSFSNPSVPSPTSQLILQPFLRFSYVTGSSLTSGEPPMYNLKTLFNTISGLLLPTFHMITFSRLSRPD